MQIGELTKRLGIPYRHARYVLEQGLLPTGVDEHPGKGGHRQLQPKQAFWVAMVLVLKQSGLRAPLAAQIADYVQNQVRGIASNLGWDHGFHPFLGRFDTEHKWFADVGDFRFVRIATSANPSRKGLCELPWWEIRARKNVEAEPIVIIRIDIAHLAKLLWG